MSIADKLLQAFNTHTNSVAISHGDILISYGDLQQQSAKVAAYLTRLNLQNAFVGVDIDSPVAHIIAVIGVVLSGNCYVSLTPENCTFLADSGLPLALTLSSTTAEGNSVCIDDVLQNEFAIPQVCPQITGDMNMCAFFTSGSTGRSKIIVHQHKNIYNDTLRQITDNAISPADRIDLVFSLSFSASLACIYPALMTGARLCIFDLKTEGLTRVAEFWQQEGITFSTLSVSSFQGICKIHPSLHHLTALRFISISAEPVKDTTISLFQTTFGPAVSLQIAYASTETRTISEMKIVNDGLPIIYPDAIGKPVADKLTRIVDEGGNELPTGATGEIVVDSRFIAAAYYGQPEESKYSFELLGNNMVRYKTGDLGYFNAEGYLFYQGRLKNEHKLNGVKINLLDIEQQIEKVKGILKVAVVINSANTEQPKLACFYETTDGAILTNDIIREAIAGSLPASHIPHWYVYMQNIPLTHSGKTDRKKLEFIDVKANIQRPALFLRNGHNNADIQQLITIFNKVLEVNDVKGDTDFFDAGGDSLSALLCVSEIETQLQVNLNVSTLVANPTPNKLHDYLKRYSNSGQLYVITDIGEQVEGRPTLFLIGHGKNNIYKPLISLLSDKFNLKNAVYDLFGGDDSIEYPQKVINQLAVEIARYDNSILLGFSFSGFIAHQLACMVKQVAYCVLIETYDYFEYDKYIGPKSRKAVIENLCQNFFINGDLGYPLFFLKERYKRKKKQVQNGPPANKTTQQFNIKINQFLASLQHTDTINNCIYFQGSRHRHNDSRSWRSKIGGKFYYKSMPCQHMDIIEKKAKPIARFIIKKAVN